MFRILLPIAFRSRRLISIDLRDLIKYLIYAREYSDNLSSAQKSHSSTITTGFRVTDHRLLYLGYDARMQRTRTHELERD